MDPDFQLKVHFNANGVQWVKKLTTLQRGFLIGGSHNTNHMTIFLDHVTNFFYRHVIRIAPPPVQIPNGLFTLFLPL